jgi:SecD/SecF fusion protein
MRVIPFMRYKWWFLVTLTAVTIFAIITIFIVRLDLGIDFVGGVRMQVGLEQEASVDEVRSVVSDLGVQEPVVQSVTGSSGTNGFLITAEEMTQEQRDLVEAELDARFGVAEGSVGVEEVGGSFSRETANRAFIAIAIAVVAIIAYLTLRFEFKFALPAIAALVHDVGLTLGIYAASNRLVTAATVAAILTILGYSVHDTIVIFDRMRENANYMKKETYAEMADLSIAQTMVRSINTSVCLLLPLLAILVFGGPTLTDFAFALTIGVITGTYSSFFVAVPLAVLWKEREPRYRKRLVAAAAGGAPVDDLDLAVSDAGAEPALKAATGKATQPKAGQAGKASGGKRPQGGVSSRPQKGKTSSKRPSGKAAKRKPR